MFTGIPIEIAQRSIKEQSNYDLITNYITRSRIQWRRELIQGRDELVKQLKEAKYKIVKGEERTRFLDGQRSLISNELVVICRLKETDAIISKMQRFDESLTELESEEQE